MGRGKERYGKAGKIEKGEEKVFKNNCFNFFIVKNCEICQFVKNCQICMLNFVMKNFVSVKNL